MDQAILQRAVSETKKIMSWGKIKIDEADKAFSRYIRLRDKQCLKCGSSVKVNAKGLPVSHQASHFQGRGKESTRFDELNVCTLCMGCHRYFSSHPGEHYQWQVKRLGQEVVEQIVLTSNMYTKKNREAEKIYWRQRLREDYGV